MEQRQAVVSVGHPCVLRGSKSHDTVSFGHEGGPLIKMAVESLLQYHWIFSEINF